MNENKLYITARQIRVEARLVGTPVEVTWSPVSAASARLTIEGIPVSVRCTGATVADWTWAVIDSLCAAGLRYCGYSVRVSAV